LELLEKLKERTAVVGVIGLGYVGLPLITKIAESGFKTIGFDTDKEKISLVNSGDSYITDLDAEKFRSLVNSGKIVGKADASASYFADVVCICVPTPLSKTKTPDIRHIISATESIAKDLRKGQLIILESTTYPGTTTEVVLPLLESTGLKVGQDFYLAFSPERIDPGNKEYHMGNTTKVVGGLTENCTTAASGFYQQFVNDVFEVSSATAAESVKLLENTFRAVNIALANEFAQICDMMDLDVWEIVDAASSKPFGFMPFYPGPGLGGHCIPIDPQYLIWKSRLHGYSPRLIDLASQINADMPQYVVEKATNKLDELKINIETAKILIIGVAYKRNVADLREAPALAIIHLLQLRKASISYHDPYVPHLTVNEISYKSLALSDSMLNSFDLIVIVTDHSVIDYGQFTTHIDRVIDTRNCLQQ